MPLREGCQLDRGISVDRKEDILEDGLFTGTPLEVTASYSGLREILVYTNRGSTLYNLVSCMIRVHLYGKGTSCP